MSKTRQSDGRGTSAEITGDVILANLSTAQRRLLKQPTDKHVEVTGNDFEITVDTDIIRLGAAASRTGMRMSAAEYNGQMVTYVIESPVSMMWHTTSATSRIDARWLSQDAGKEEINRLHEGHPKTYVWFNGIWRMTAGVYEEHNYNS